MKKLLNHTLKIVVVLLLFFAIKNELKAAHLVGGYMNYECLGNDNYKINLTVYRDCSGTGANFDTNAPFGVFNNGNLVSTELAPFSLIRDTIEVVIDNPCLIAPPNVCVEKTEYTITINLPPIAGGYDIVYQRCCRNAAAMNIVTPSTKGSTYSVHIPEAAKAICNNSPTFNNPPPTAMCAGYQFTYDLSATDPDGDSLYYTFKDPVTGGAPGAPAPNPPTAPPFTVIPWAAGYSTNYQIDANPVFTLDPQTGGLIGSPNTIGIFTFSITVKEYRNGVYLNEVYQDLLVYVNNCQINTLADFSDDPTSTSNGQSQYCSGTTVTMTNNSVNSGYFFWDFGDLTTDADTSILNSPSYTYPDTGVYNITLIANPGEFCADTAVHQFYVYPALEPSYVAPPTQCLQDNLFDFNAVGNNNTNDTVTWDFGASAFPSMGNGANSQTSFPTTGTFHVEMTLSNFGCSESYLDSVTIIENPIASFSPQDPNSLCDGLSVTFDNNSTNSSSSFWNFGDATISTQDTPNHTYQDSGLYNVMLVANQQNVCYDTTYNTYNLYPILDVNFAPQPDQCFINNSFTLDAIGNYNNNAIFTWNFNGQGNPTNTNTAQTTINFNSIGSYPVSLTVDNYGCTSFHSDILNIHIEPSALFVAPDTVGCQPFKTSFINNSISTSALTYFWDFGNGTTSNQENPTITFYEPGFFDVSLIVSTSSGCIASDTISMSNLITVSPQPKVEYAINPLQTYFMNHEITTEDLSTSLIHQFSFGDGSVYTDSIATHTYDEPGYYVFDYMVTNEFGCSNYDQQNIWIKPDFLFFPPNSFTPNGDGLNDEFFIRVDGIKEYNLTIHNRWGEIVFSSDNDSNGWNGKYKNKNAQIGLYTWKVVLKTIDHLEHEYLGKVNLIR